MSKHRTTESVERLALILEDGAILHHQAKGATIIRDLAAERDHLLAAQSYTYIGKDGKPVLARDLEDERDALRARLDEAEARMAEIWNIETSDMKDLSDFGIGHEFRRAFNRARTIARAFLNGGGNG